MTQCDRRPGYPKKYQSYTMILQIDDDATHEDTSRQHQPQDGSGEPDSECRRMIGALPAYPDPDNVGTPMAPATQGQVTRPGVPPDKNKDEIDDGGCKEEERDEERQYAVQES